MMKRYVNPVAELLAFMESDLIRTSVGTPLDVKLEGNDPDMEGNW